MARVTFDDVLDTYYFPTGDERRLLATLINSKEQELTALNDMIAPLLAKRDKLNNDILAHKALLPPVRCLPPELLEQVFFHSINYFSPASDTSHKSKALCRFAIPSMKEAPLLLGRICRHWRKIALSTPTLWSTISIPRSFSISGLQEWISRAGSCNLSFELWIERTNMEALNMLVSYQHRWCEVALGLAHHSSNPEGGREFLTSLSPAFPSLQTLQIYEWAVRSSPMIPLVIGSAPNLRRLMVHDYEFRVTTLDDSPPLRLREIDVRCPGWTHPTYLLMLLRLFPSVHVISANLMYQFHDEEPHHDILTIPALKRMDITVHHRHHYYCVLERLCLPALEDLSFHTNVARESTSQIRSLIHRSRPPLRVLRILGRNHLPPIDIMECLPFLPLLSILHLEGKIEGLIIALTGPIPPSSDDLPGCLCPELNDIYFDGDGTDDVSPEPVINMILSRSPSGRSKLAHVAVRSCPEREVMADPRIIRCIENGLKFEGHKWT